MYCIYAHIPMYTYTIRALIRLAYIGQDVIWVVQQWLFLRM